MVKLGMVEMAQCFTVTLYRYFMLRHVEKKTPCLMFEIPKSIALVESSLLLLESQCLLLKSARLLEKSIFVAVEICLFVG